MRACITDSLFTKYLCYNSCLRMLITIWCCTVLQIICTRAEGYHGDKYLDFLSCGLSEHRYVTETLEAPRGRGFTQSQSVHYTDQQFSIFGIRGLKRRRHPSGCEQYYMFKKLAWLRYDSTLKPEQWLIIGEKSVSTFGAWGGSRGVTQVNWNHCDLLDPALQK